MGAWPIAAAVSSGQGVGLAADVALTVWLVGVLVVLVVLATSRPGRHAPATGRRGRDRFGTPSQRGAGSPRRRRPVAAGQPMGASSTRQPAGL
jgi:hypothetical protein